MSVNLQLRLFKTPGNLYTWNFVNAVGYHNKYLLGSLEATIITGRALAKNQKCSWGAAGGGKGEGTGGSCPLYPTGSPMFLWIEINTDTAVFCNTDTEYHDTDF